MKKCFIPLLNMCITCQNIYIIKKCWPSNTSWPPYNLHAAIGPEPTGLTGALALEYFILHFKSFVYVCNIFLQTLVMFTAFKICVLLSLFIVYSISLCLCMSGLTTL